MLIFCSEGPLRRDLVRLHWNSGSSFWEPLNTSFLIDLQYSPILLSRNPQMLGFPASLLRLQIWGSLALEFLLFCDWFCSGFTSWNSFETWSSPFLQSCFFQKTHWSEKFYWYLTVFDSFLTTHSPLLRLLALIFQKKLFHFLHNVAIFQNGKIDHLICDCSADKKRHYSEYSSNDYYLGAPQIH